MIVATAGVRVGGVVLVVVAVIVEMGSNRLAKPILDSEFTSGSPQDKLMTTQRTRR